MVEKVDSEASTPLMKSKLKPGAKLVQPCSLPNLCFSTGFQLTQFLMTPTILSTQATVLVSQTDKAYFLYRGVRNESRMAEVLLLQSKTFDIFHWKYMLSGSFESFIHKVERKLFELFLAKVFYGVMRVFKTRAINYSSKWVFTF